MKITIFFLIIALIPFSNLISNPVALPQAFISELKFEENNKWLLEISFRFNTVYRKNQFDSICVATLNGFSRIRLDNIADNTSLFVITSDSLTNPLSIINEGDYIKLYSFLSSPYSSGKPLIDSLYFGNYPGSVIDSLPTGYSIARLYSGVFSKDKNPTIGLPNDTIGTCGVLSGHIYDKNNKLMIKGIFYLDDYFSFLNDSTYLTNVFSRKVIFNSMYVDQSRNWLKINPLELNINPGIMYELDIHILEDITSVKENANKLDYEIRVINYPNPFNSSTNFAITIPSSQKYNQKQINIYNALGQKINSIALSNQSSVQWGGKDFSGTAVATGIYYYQLVLDNNIYKSGSMILLK
jgi:hypothetical protein